ncbi:MAG: calcium/sodium antiporter [Patescibacteria group bacterium]|jgi:cation:H+ antiporter|nr:calcium/sodium antiporter [Patescibacteria group bacterium]
MISVLITIGLFVVGLVLLIYGADSLVRGASSVAKKFGLSNLFIGLTVVAFGTSLPELVVNLFASFRGSNDIAIGNIVGSNISNILLILGIAALIYPLTVKHGTVSREIPFSFLAVVVLFILANDFLMDGLQASILSRGDGLILIAFFIIFMYYTFGISKSSAEEAAEPVKTYKNYVALSMIFGGILGTVIGGQFMVESAVKVATMLGVSEALIGLTIVAVGTSLPELAASAIAAYHKKSDIAIGNIIGSNIFNVFWILGVSTTIKPLYFSLALNSDLILLIIITIILLSFMFIGKKNIVQRWQGGTMVGLYAAYVIYLIIRG